MNVYDWLKGVRDSVLPSTAKLTAFVLSTYMDAEYGECFPSRALIAQGIGKSPSTVTRALRKLEDEGWIEKKRRMNATSLVRRKFPDGAHIYWTEDDLARDEPF